MTDPNGWRPREEAEEREEEVLCGFFRDDGSEYDRKRMAAMRKRDWPIRVEFWDRMQRIHPTHFFVPPTFALPTPPAQEKVKS